MLTLLTAVKVTQSAFIKEAWVTSIWVSQIADRHCHTSQLVSVTSHAGASPPRPQQGAKPPAPHFFFFFARSGQASECHFVPLLALVQLERRGIGARDYRLERWCYSNLFPLAPMLFAPKDRPRLRAAARAASCFASQRSSFSLSRSRFLMLRRYRRCGRPSAQRCTAPRMP